MMQFSDSHCHLDFPEFQHLLPQLLEQCHQHNINRIIVPAVEPQHWQRVISLTTNAHQSPVAISPCIGIHPWFFIPQNNIQSNEPSNKSINSKSLHAFDVSFHEQQLKQVIKKYSTEIVAIGECGIDVFKAKKNTENEQDLNENINLQQAHFEMQLDIAKQNDLPIIVHHCQSHHLIMPLLKKYQLNKAGVIHAFSGSYQQAKTYVDLGFKLGIGGTITYPRSKKTINAVKRLPLTSLLLETDAPAMPPLGQQGRSNTPLNILAVFSALNAIRDETPEEIALQIENNIKQLFFS